MKPSEQIRLYGLNNYFNEIINLHNQKKMPSKIMLSGNKGLGKSTLAYHIINFILSKSEKDNYDLNNFKINNINRSYKLVQNNTHPNFYLVDLMEEKKSIDINQIREMITFTNKSTFNTQPKYILIDNIENLNKNSANALLKIIEEPNENTYFILIHNNNKNILQTLKSRCLVFKIYLTFDKTIEISNLLLNENLYDKINIDLINYYNTPGVYVNLFKFAKNKDIDLKNILLADFLKFLIENNFYKKNTFIKDLIFNYIELFFLKEYKISNTKNSLINLYYDFVKKINYTNTFNLDQESLFLEFKLKMLNE